MESTTMSGIGKRSKFLRSLALVPGVKARSRGILHWL